MKRNIVLSLTAVALLVVGLVAGSLLTRLVLTEPALEDENEKTGYISVSAAAFRPESTYGNEWFYNQGHTVHRGSGELHHAPVQLPHGAILTKVTGYFNAITPSTILSLHRNNMDGSYQIMANITTEIWGGPRVACDDSIEFATIDNSQYSYYLQLTLGIEDIRLHGVVIEYTFTEPDLLE